jgi:putative methyltransferase (TIGR04325 family)
MIRACLPPSLLKLGIRLLRLGNVYIGNYSCWDEAKLDAKGYDAKAIFERVRDAGLKVKQGTALYERDSVCFYEEDYRWPVLACLLSVAAQENGKLNVLDFGGSLGSFYFQHVKFLNKLKSVMWSVVEQPHFVECGRQEFQDERLKFYMDCSECINNEKVDLVLLSSVLQYIESPQEVLEEIAKVKAKYILIDRTPFINGSHNRLTVQNVPTSIYKASYPAWFFSNKVFDKWIAEIDYKIIHKFECDEDVGIGEFKGCFLERIER